MSAKLDTHRKIELRRAIASSAFTMVMLVAVIGLFSLFSIWSIDRAWLSGTAETADLQRLSRESLDAQVAFKVQVQEWKNVLLRGEDAALLERYLASFRGSAGRTESPLARVAGEARRLGLAREAEAAHRLAQAHESLSERYEAALAGARGGAAALPLAAAVAIDTALRGIDRDLESGIGALAEDIAAASEAKRAGLAARMQERYSTLRWFIIGVIALSLLITGYAVSGALRATRG